jgi:mRNA-degrading endonuclease toxin of MazEF toxin-antitoxin module
LIISADVRNAVRDHAILIPIFSSGRTGPTRVALPAGVGGIDHDSMLFCDEITTLHHRFLGERPLGPPVPGRILKEVVKAVRRAVGEVVSEPEPEAEE